MTGVNALLNLPQIRSGAVLQYRRGARRRYASGRGAAAACARAVRHPGLERGGTRALETVDGTRALLRGASVCLRAADTRRCFPFVEAHRDAARPAATAA